MKSNKISISFSEYYTEIYNYLKSKENISNFICQLVKSEMTAKDTVNSELEAKIEEIIKKILKENQYVCDNSYQPTTSQNIVNLLSEGDKSLIKDLF